MFRYILNVRLDPNWHVVDGNKPWNEAKCAREGLHLLGCPLVLTQDPATSDLPSWDHSINTRLQGKIHSKADWVQTDENRERSEASWKTGVSPIPLLRKCSWEWLERRNRNISSMKSESIQHHGSSAFGYFDPWFLIDLWLVCFYVKSHRPWNVAVGEYTSVDFLKVFAAAFLCYP